MHITDNYDNPISLFEKWLKEAESNDNLGWNKVMTIATVHEYVESINKNYLTEIKPFMYETLILQGIGSTEPKCSTTKI